MPKPICVKCKLFFKPKNTGITWEEGMPLRDTAEWGPYKLWMADLHECRGCGAQIIVGHGRDPIAEHFQPDYAATRENSGDVLRVNDC